MRYVCPFCGSNKKPKIVNYFPPMICQCIDCYKRSHEKNFLIDDDRYGYSSLPQYNI